MSKIRKQNLRFLLWKKPQMKPGNFRQNGISRQTVLTGKTAAAQTAVQTIAQEAILQITRTVLLADIIQRRVTAAVLPEDIIQKRATAAVLLEETVQKRATAAVLPVDIIQETVVLTVILRKTIHKRAIPAAPKRANVRLV